MAEWSEEFLECRKRSPGRGHIVRATYYGEDAVVRLGGMSESKLHMILRSKEEIMDEGVWNPLCGYPIYLSVLMAEQFVPGALTGVGHFG